jgi:hypothetical protein
VFLTELVAVFVFLLAVDPLDSGRFPKLTAGGPIDSVGRVVNVSRGHDPRFDAAIIGNSFGTAASILASLAGLHGFAGCLKGIGVLTIGAAASILIPPAHEIKDRWLRPEPWLAFALASLAAYCFLEVGRGPPAAFIYFRF